MGILSELYDRHVLPTLLDFACGMKAINRQRQKIVPQATGKVLEIETVYVPGPKAFTYNYWGAAYSESN